MKEIKFFFLDHNPTLHDIEQFHDFAVEQHCVVRLEWKGYCTHHFVYIHEEDAPELIYAQDVPNV